MEPIRWGAMVERLSYLSQGVEDVASAAAAAATMAPTEGGGPVNPFTRSINNLLIQALIFLATSPIEIYFISQCSQWTGGFLAQQSFGLGRDYCVWAGTDTHYWETWAKGRWTPLAVIPNGRRSSNRGCAGWSSGSHVFAKFEPGPWSCSFFFPFLHRLFSSRRKFTVRVSFPIFFPTRYSRALGGEKIQALG